MMNIIRFKRCFVAVVAVSGFFVSSAYAQEHKDPAQVDPGPAQQLNELQKKWQSFSPERQAELKERFKELKRLSPDERAVLMRKFRKFQRLSPERQERLRENQKRWRALPPAQKMELRKKFELFQKLHPERREKIRERAIERHRKKEMKDRIDRPKMRHRERILERDSRN